jgi:putative transposase
MRYGAHGVATDNVGAQQIYGTIEAWRNRPIAGEHAYVYLDSIVLKRGWAGEVRKLALSSSLDDTGGSYR